MVKNLPDLLRQRCLGYFRVLSCKSGLESSKTGLLHAACPTQRAPILAYSHFIHSQNVSLTLN